MKRYCSKCGNEFGVSTSSSTATLCNNCWSETLPRPIDYKSRAESAEAELKHFQQSADTLERILNGGYVSHKSNCNWHKTLNDDHCNCGLDALLKNSKG